MPSDNCSQEYVRYEPNTAHLLKTTVKVRLGLCAIMRHVTFLEISRASPFSWKNAHHVVPIFFSSFFPSSLFYVFTYYIFEGTDDDKQVHIRN